MRFVRLGQWLYFVWHLPALVLTGAAVVVAVLAARSLWRDTLPIRNRQLRWYLLGGSAMFAATLSVVVWPYLAAASSIRVTPDGAWHLANYLGVPIAVIPPTEVRSFVAEDLGGRRVGMGRITILREDGTAVSTVRLSGETFDRARRALGYPDEMLRPFRGGVETPAHRFSPRGPQSTATYAAR